MAGRKVCGKIITPGADVTLTLSEDSEIATKKFEIAAADCGASAEKVEQDDVVMPSVCCQIEKAGASNEAPLDTQDEEAKSLSI